MFVPYYFVNKINGLESFRWRKWGEVNVERPERNPFSLFVKAVIETNF